MAKKNNGTMKTAAVLTALVLITSCFVGSTFAKYVTSGIGSDSARVAKFGVTIIGSSGMFDKTYTAHDGSFTIATNSVVSSDKDKLVAPGTSKKLGSFAMTGTPEVAVRVSYNADTFSLTNWTTGNEEYCPLVFTVAGEEFKIGGKDKLDQDISNVQALENAVKFAIQNYSQNYPAGTDLSTKTSENLSVSWAWQFEDETEGAYQTNAKDTALGNRAATNKDEAGKIDFKVTMTVTQID